MAKNDKRFKRGMKLMRSMGRENNMLIQKEMFPDLYNISVSHLFGDVWTRPHLSIRDRELITIATNMAMGRPASNIPHFRSALHIGMRKEELMELILQVGMYAGWGTMGYALEQLKKVLEETVTSSKRKAKSGKKK